MSRTTLLILALVAVLSMAGGATAAKLITGKQIKNRSIALKDISKKARKSLRGQVGPTGPSGAVGVNGPAGEPGQSGSTAPSLVFSEWDLNPGFATYGRFNGGSHGTFDSAAVHIPSGVPLVARDFSASASKPPGDGDKYVMSLAVNGVATPLTCEIRDAATSCSAPQDATVQLEAGDEVAFEGKTLPGSESATGSASMRIVF